MNVGGAVDGPGSALEYRSDYRLPVPPLRQRGVRVKELRMDTRQGVARHRSRWLRVWPTLSHAEPEMTAKTTSAPSAEELAVVSTTTS